MDATITSTSKKNAMIFTNDFSREVYETKYKYGNETISDTWDRVSRTVAAVEKNKGGRKRGRSSGG